MDDVKATVALPLYEEFLYEALTLERSMRYDESVLYAAIAVELTLEGGCKALLKGKGNLTNDQCDAIISDRRIPSLIELIRKLDPSLRIDAGKIQDITSLRNKIAHGESHRLTWQETTTAVRIARGLKRDLAGILRGTQNPNQVD